MTKKTEKTILQRMDDECFKRPIVDSERGICRFMSKCDDDLSVWGRLKMEGDNNASIT
jgi:hypothetical protein